MGRWHTAISPVYVGHVVARFSSHGGDEVRRWSISSAPAISGGGVYCPFPHPRTRLCPSPESPNAVGTADWSTPSTGGIWVVIVLSNIVHRFLRHGRQRCACVDVMFRHVSLAGTVTGRRERDVITMLVMTCITMHGPGLGHCRCHSLI